MVDTLFALVKQGFNVIPVNDNKKPVIPYWRKFQTDPIDDNTLKNLGEICKKSAAGIAVITGFNNIECIDFDNKKGNSPEIYKIVEEIISTGIPLYVENTKTNGVHILYRCDVVGKNQKLAGKLVGDEIEYFIETRGHGGYVIVAPSNGYVSFAGCDITNIPTITPEQRDDILAICKSYNTIKKKITKKHLNDFDVPVEFAKNILIEAGWKYAGKRDEYENYTRPNKSSGVSAGWDANGRWIVFTTQTVFENDRSYSPYEVVLYQKFNGNKSECDKFLAENGFAVKKVEFWTVTDKKVSIEEHKLVNFIANNNFAKYAYKTNNDTIYRYVKLDGHIVSFVTPTDITDFVYEYLKENAPDEVCNIFVKKIMHFQSNPFLSLIPTFNGKFVEDNRDKAFFFYTNCWVSVTDEGITSFSYSELEGYIWKTQIINRTYNFVPVDRNFSFFRFIRLIANDDIDRVNTIFTTIGYMLHRYKDPSLAKMIVLTDEGDADDDVFTPRGRSGKSLLFELALGKMRNLAKLDGKDFNFDRPFAFQTIDIDTNIVLIDDIKRNFKVESMFSKITNSLLVEKKGKTAYVIPFEQSPKFALTSNYPVYTDSVSAKSRIIIVELNNYFNEVRTPKSEFGEVFFTDWDTTKWNMFDTLILFCVQVYLKEGITEYQRINHETKEFLAMYGEEFVNWIRDFILEQSHDGMLNSIEFYVDDAIKSYNEYMRNLGSNNRNPMNIRKMKQGFKKLASLDGHQFKDKRVSKYKKHKIWINLNPKSIKDKTIDDFLEVE